jgi:hypothetical protein
MTRIRALVGGLAATAVLVAAQTASAHLPKTVTIRFQTRGCHSWSFAGGPYKTSLKVTIDRDSGLFVVNDDMMEHKLVQISGPKASIATPRMDHVASRAYVTFPRAGVYVFSTKQGPMYMKMNTSGPDNILRLRVRVVD